MLRFASKNDDFFSIFHDGLTSIRRLASRAECAECAECARGMVTFFPARSPVTRAGKKDDTRMHKANSLKLL